MILFTKPDCSRCNWIKEHCDLANISVQDVTTPEGLALLAYYECVSIAEKEGLPILVKGDNLFTVERILGTDNIAKELETESKPTNEDCKDGTCTL